MNVTRSHAWGALVLVLLISCGSEAVGPSAETASKMNMSANLAEAIDDVRSNVDALIERVAPGAPKTVRSDNSQQQSCNDAEGAPTGEVRSQFGYIVEGQSLDATAALKKTRAFFATKGFAVNTSRLTDDPPALFATGRGFNYSAIVNSVGNLVVGGTTPCFPSE